MAGPAMRDTPATRIAMWSGPRNISTAMMYAFASRPDCAVWDEPFYSFFLTQAGIAHPMDTEVIAAGEPDFARVVARCLGAPPQDKPVFYQKHMTHHMLEGFDRRWALGLANAFLIRAPERVVASYARKRETASLRDIGVIEQAEIFDMVADHLGAAPPVVDTDDILAGPRGMLAALCQALGLGFDASMLSWAKGPKPYDGAWAAHWYNAVWQSTGFATPPTGAPQLTGELARLAEAARPYYERIRPYRLKAAGG
jgi:hypothetical protein